MQLCFDIDNVLADSDPVLRQIIYEHTGGRVNLDRDDVIEFNYCSCPDKKGQLLNQSEWHEVHSLFSAPGIISSIELFPGVRDHLECLSEKYEIHIATSRLPETVATTTKWLEKHGISEYRLHFMESGRKHDALTSLDLMIEDHYEQAAAFAKNGTKCFLLSYPWNVNKSTMPQLEWVNGWDELMARLLDLTP